MPEDRELPPHAEGGQVSTRPMGWRRGRVACGDAVSAAGDVAARGGLGGHPSLSSLRLLYSGFLSPPLGSCTSAPTAPLPPPLLSVRAAVAPPDAPPCPPGPGAGGCVALPVENGSPGLAPWPGRLPALWAVR